MDRIRISPIEFRCQALLLTDENIHSELHDAIEFIRCQFLKFLDVRLHHEFFSASSISSAYLTVSIASRQYLSAPMASAYSCVNTAPPTQTFAHGACSRRSLMVSSIAGTVVVISADRPTIGACRRITSSTTVCSGTSFPRSDTANP